MGNDERTQSIGNDSETSGSIDTVLTQAGSPDVRTMADLRSYLHSYRIRHPGDLPRSARASIIINGIDELAKKPDADRAYLILLDMHRAAKELADLDPAVSWLAVWKPRVSATALAKDDRT